jgi:hypothetical protein
MIKHPTRSFTFPLSSWPLSVRMNLPPSETKYTRDSQTVQETDVPTIVFRI